VVGHILSVLVGHIVALREFRDLRAVIRSQLLMLVLMPGYTTASLWIIAHPDSRVRRDPLTAVDKRWGPRRVQSHRETARHGMRSRSRRGGPSLLLAAAPKRAATRPEKAKVKSLFN
jgi:hypothetical protein